jgi:hypothetical protein
MAFARFARFARAYDYDAACSTLATPLSLAGGAAAFVAVAVRPTPPFVEPWTCPQFVGACVVGTALGAACGVAAAFMHPLLLVVPPAAVACALRPRPPTPLT